MTDNYRRILDSNSTYNGATQLSTEGDHAQSIEDSGSIIGDLSTHNGVGSVDNKLGAGGDDNYIAGMKKGNSNIMVSVRCRPLSIKEKAKQSQRSVKILDEKVVIIQDVSAAKPEEAFRLQRSKEKQYAFDYAFDENCQQKYVFDKTTKFLIDGIMHGYNASVFAYGSTGAGKTHTMLGTEDNPGIMMLSIEELFNCIENYTAERDYKIKISYVEVYNENIKDLLTDRSDNLELREDTVKGVCVAGVMEIMTTNTDEIMGYIIQGNRARTKERTDANEASSRSHAVLQITVEHKDKAPGLNAEINIAKLSLIDLAGSERASNTNNRGIRLVEGANINKSLLSLGNCINALCDQAKSGQKNVHIPYRDSKLTRLLKDSLGGNCRTVMIANISPAFSAYEDTLNTLKYADRAKQIKTVAKRNVLNVEYHISNYTKIITQLRDEILNLRNQLQHASINKHPAGNSNAPRSRSNNQGGNYNSTNNPHSNSGHNSNTNNSHNGGQNNQQASNKIKTMKIDMNMQFEKEVTIKKEIYELDMKNEDLAFKLFSKQLILTKNKNKGLNTQQVENESKILKQEIEQNYTKKAQLQKQLTEFENHRAKLLDDYQQEMLEYEIETIDVIYNQHLLNLKQIDIKRKENRAEFHIKQRDNYIHHLKEQLSIRDKIIKEKLGVSITNFMPAQNRSNGPLGEYGNYALNEGVSELFTMQDIDRMSRELILPSLNMTKSSSFIPNMYNQGLMQNHPGGQQNKVQHGNQLHPSESPYQNSNQQSPNQMNIGGAINGGHGYSVNTSQSVKSGGVKSVGLKPRPFPQSNNGVINLKEDAGRLNSLEDSRSNQSNILKKSGQGLLYSSSDQRYGLRGISKIGAGASSQHNTSQLVADKKAINNGDQADESDSQLINQSVQSHRNNSHSRIGMGVYHFQNQANTPASAISNNQDGSKPKSFAAEMSKNKQKFVIHKQQQQQLDHSQPRSKAIPKHPLTINKKLTLLKQHHGNISGEDISPNNNQSFSSSRNHNQSQSQVSGTNVRQSNLLQSNNSQIPVFGARRPSEQGHPHNNANLINIADNL